MSRLAKQLLLSLALGTVGGYFLIAMSHCPRHPGHSVWADCPAAWRTFKASIMGFHP